MTQSGLAGGPLLTTSAFSLRFNGVDTGSGTVIKRLGSGNWTVLDQAIGSPTLGQVQYQVSAADVEPDGVGPWNFVMEAAVTFPDSTTAISDNIQGPQIVPRLPAS